MSHPYNLRRNQRKVTNEMESSHKDLSDDPTLADISNSDELHDTSNSDLSATAIDSIHTGQSPSEKYHRLYPQLPKHSPQSRKRHAKRPSGSDLSESHSQAQTAGKERDSKISFAQILIVVGIMVISLFVISCYIGNHPQTSEESENVALHRFTQFSHQIELLSREFPGQHSTLWRIIKSCVKHVLETQDPLYPGILLMAAHHQTAALTFDITNKLAENFEAAAQLARSGVPHDLSFNISQKLRGLEAEEQKLKLDEWLREQLLLEGRAVVLHHLEQLLPDAALLLHGYCDGENAPYKNALLIFTLYLDKIPSSAHEVESFLNKLLITRLPEDKVRALLSRIANNIAVVHDT